MDLFILALYIGHFTINSANSAIAPFFPQRAIQYGISESLIGVIFAIHPFGNFICTIILGKNLQIGHNRKKFTLLGILLTGIGILIFAFGQSLFCTPAFAYIPIVYKDNFEQIFAYMESAGAIGSMMGPILGSLLLKMYGYRSIIMGISFIFLGPDPYTGFAKNMYCVIFANISIGIACILIYIPALPQFYKIIKFQYPQDNDTMIGDISSALFNTSYALGEFAGPLLVQLENYVYTNCGKQEKIRSEILYTNIGQQRR
ncbi:major facilitator superfamily protein, putative [Ichthyophthirius multifiliis]|uniref:Major facilitator superfamily protein, putative n=1 Tax=Ichthyophthirius multifiliis TaxID=5932 RepID=G0R6M8_ICHMU|nr:major facilitator superfamily protein, putative [Ichthyophthirius multifiliis]EGR26878.1 major facilitator superfamily protein, putative [Ichthyophthirius multifiliis]|eukprot:XP_004023762.1 major facilitator superfamily protein, putative [Ichthyophthirius multifiliis]